MPRPLVITLKEGVDPVYGLQKSQIPEKRSIEEIYTLMGTTNTYALGVGALREACKKEFLRQLLKSSQKIQSWIHHSELC